MPAPSRISRLLWRQLNIRKLDNGLQAVAAKSSSRNIVWDFLFLGSQKIWLWLFQRAILSHPLLNSELPKPIIVWRPPLELMRHAPFFHVRIVFNLIMFNPAMLMEEPSVKRRKRSLPQWYCSGDRTYVSPFKAVGNNSFCLHLKIFRTTPVVGFICSSGSPIPGRLWSRLSGIVSRTPSCFTADARLECLWHVKTNLSVVWVRLR